MSVETQSRKIELNHAQLPVLTTGVTEATKTVSFLRKRISVAIAVLFILTVTGWALFPTIFTSHNPIAGIPADKFTAPNATYWFGTDHLGRDVFSRVVHGSTLSLQAATIAIAVSLSVGCFIGVLAGFRGGWLDGLFMRGIDVLLAIPNLLLSLSIVTVLGFGTVKVAFAVGVAGIPVFARVMRAQVLKIRQAPYLEAAQLFGVKPFTIIRRHVIPNAYGPVAVLATVEFGAVILAVSALSFLGFGAAPPQPEWGSLISEGRNYLGTAWWYSTLPGLVIVVFVVSVNVLGRALRNRQGES